MSTPVPIGQGPRRLPQSGRIRIGEKGGRQGRRSINTFRFTSGDPDLLAPVAARYGGQVRHWNEPKSGDTHEVITEAKKIAVILPPDPLSESFELWDAKVGLTRRCDGLRCAVSVPGPDGPEIVERTCVCATQGAIECVYKLRLSVLLPEVSSIGTWRLDTSSEHAKAEIPGVVDLIELASGRGLTQAWLRLEQRTAPGRRFNVPVLDLGVPVEALMAGDARLVALPRSPQGPPPTMALEEGEARAAEVTASSAAPSPDDEIIEAEVIEHVDPTIARATFDAMPTKVRNQILLDGRDIAEELGEPIPTNIAALTEPVLDRLAEVYFPHDQEPH